MVKLPDCQQMVEQNSIKTLRLQHKVKGKVGRAPPERRRGAHLADT